MARRSVLESAARQRSTATSRGTTSSSAFFAAERGTAIPPPRRRSDRAVVALSPIVWVSASPGELAARRRQPTLWHPQGSPAWLRPGQIDQHDQPPFLDHLVIQEPAALGKHDRLVPRPADHGERGGADAGVDAQQGHNAGNVAAQLGRGAAELLADATSHYDLVGQARPQPLPRGWSRTGRPWRPGRAAGGSRPPAWAAWAAGRSGWSRRSCGQHTRPGCAGRPASGSRPDRRGRRALRFTTWYLAHPLRRCHQLISDAVAGRPRPRTRCPACLSMLQEGRDAASLAAARWALRWRCWRPRWTGSWPGRSATRLTTWCAIAVDAVSERQRPCGIMRYEDNMGPQGLLASCPVRHLPRTPGPPRQRARSAVDRPPRGGPGATARPGTPARHGRRAQPPPGLRRPVVGHPGGVALPAPAQGAGSDVRG